MKVLEPGHHYKLDTYDGSIFVDLIFMKRIGMIYPGNELTGPEHGGTNCQEVLRALIDRVKYVHNQQPHYRNHSILVSLRFALYDFEARAAERHGLKKEWEDYCIFHTKSLSDRLELLPTCTVCGHLVCKHKADGNG